MLQLGLRAALVVGLLVGACGADAPVEETIREDLNATTFSTSISNGLSGRIEFEVPFGVQSMLIEVRGDRGLYYLTEFVTPSGKDLIEQAAYTTRGAREIPGLVDWLYPNEPSAVVEEGTYSLLIRGRDAFTNENLNGEDIKVSIYMSQDKPEDTCGLHVDFLVDDAALSLESFDLAVERIVEQLDLNYRQVGIKIADYQTYRINMQSPDIDLGDGSATSIVDDVLARTIPLGAARQNSLHVMLVRRIGGSDNPTFDPAGYSMGLPGPYAANRGTSAVLVSTELYADGTGVLDADGLASSLAHEMGHFLGLYHTSEREGANHDPIADTPQCDNEFSCTDEFRRNIMTSSFWLQGGPPAGRNVFSEGQGKVMRGHPLCEPMSVNVITPPVSDCTLDCDAPRTCAVLNQRETCATACIPDSVPCASGVCESDELGTYVCQ